MSCWNNFRPLGLCEIRRVLNTANAARLAVCEEGQPVIVPLSYQYVPTADGYVFTLYSQVGSREVLAIQNNPLVALSFERLTIDGTEVVTATGTATVTLGPNGTCALITVTVAAEDVVGRLYYAGCGNGCGCENGCGCGNSTCGCGNSTCGCGNSACGCAAARAVDGCGCGNSGCGCSACGNSTCGCGNSACGCGNSNCGCAAAARAVDGCGCGNSACGCSACGNSACGCGWGCSDAEAAVYAGLAANRSRTGCVGTGCPGRRWCGGA